MLCSFSREKRDFLKKKEKKEKSLFTKFYFHSMFSSLKSFGSSLLGLPKVQKTEDPRYDDAKANLKILQQDTEKLVGTMSQMLSKMRDISKTAMTIGMDIREWCNDPENEESQNQFLTIDSFCRSFDNLTANFLIPRLQPALIKPLALFHAEVNRLTKEKSLIKEWRFKYDYNRTYEEYYTRKKSDEGTIEKYRKEAQSAREEYEKYNEDFINSMKKLYDARSNMLEKQLREFVAITSQYYLMIFQEVQKFRTTFPEETLNKGPTPKKKSITEIVFEEEEDDEQQTFTMTSSNNIFNN